MFKKIKGYNSSYSDAEYEDYYINVNNIVFLEKGCVIYNEKKPHHFSLSLISETTRTTIYFNTSEELENAIKKITGIEE